MSTINHRLYWTLSWGPHPVEGWFGIEKIISQSPFPSFSIISQWWFSIVRWFTFIKATERYFGSLPIDDVPLKNAHFPINNGDFPNKNCDFPTNICDVSTKKVDFPSKSCDFPIKYVDFPNKNCDFPIKHGDFP